MAVFLSDVALAELMVFVLEAVVYGVTMMAEVRAVG
jgi:hypothetical protein